jgi:glutamate-1-semialdehyde 2,1-aminomutase
VPLPREFLSGLREATSAAGVVLVFDEVISAFRCARGGAQEAFSIRPDLTTLGKIVAGGLPGAAVGGRAEILDLLSFEAGARRGIEKIPHQGTFNANPLSAAAGVAMLEVIRDTDVCERASPYAAALRCELQGVFTRLGVPWLSYGSFSGFHVLTGDAGVRSEDLDAGRVRAESIKGAVDRELIRLLRLGLLAHGVDLMPWPGGLTSAVHGEEDLERTASAFERTVTLLRDEGLLDRRGGGAS